MNDSIRNPFRLTAICITYDIPLKSNEVDSGEGHGVELDYHRLADAYDKNPLFRWYVRRKMKSFAEALPRIEDGK